MSSAALELLVDAVDSFEKLELVCLVARAGSQQIPAAATTLGMAEEQLRDAARELVAAKILREDTAGLTLDPTSKRHAAVRELVTVYEQDRVKVMNRMTKIALEKIRANAARTFADAFVLRPKKKGDDDDG